MKGRPDSDRSHNFTEAQLVRRLAELLRNEGYRVRLEVSNMGQSVDVVATQGRWVTAIEVKRYDWQRALQQCRTHEAIADYICIAIGMESVPEALCEAAKAQGYGILQFERCKDQFTWKTRPRFNCSMWKPQRRYWSRSLRGAPYAD